MAKFYVQSGTVRAIIDSVDVDRAALWVVNEVMNQTLPIDELTDEELCVVQSQDASAHKLSETICISEQGFDRDDAMVVDSLEVFRHWYELYNAVSILANRLGM
jgi:hypothetical protein